MILRKTMTWMCSFKLMDPHLNIMEVHVDEQLVLGKLQANCILLLIPNYMIQFVGSNIIHYITHFR